jgi:hypothetical protein
VKYCEGECLPFCEQSSYQILLHCANMISFYTGTLMAIMGLMIYDIPSSNSYFGTLDNTG